VSQEIWRYRRSSPSKARAAQRTCLLSLGLFEAQLNLDYIHLDSQKGITRKPFQISHSVAATTITKQQKQA